MVKAISILGSTGSVGRQTAAVAARQGIPVRALAAGSNTELLEEQIRRFRPALASVADAGAAASLRARISDLKTEVLCGPEGLLACAAASGADCVVTAVSGSVGLRPTLAAVDRGLRIALANKETLVCAGELVMSRARETGAEIVPVDSEHSAIFQCLAGREKEELRRIWLTGSGGPFRGWSREKTAAVTPAMALRHPNWNMGAKISIDSATMMNKGLEFIEAMHLFSVAPDRVRVMIHPESVVHSAVELIDGAVIAQLGVPDMALPIQYALTYPARRGSAAAPLDLPAVGALRFEEPDFDAFPCLRLAMDCAVRGGTAPAVLSAANEEAVALFLRGAIGFNEIYDRVAAALESAAYDPRPELDAILAADAEARRLVRGRA
jgi:1-deoxy-D-xylulose-5-phosphate reductoisomerase